MKIFSNLFEAFLKCPTKCWLLANGASASGNEYADWVKAQNMSSGREKQNDSFQKHPAPWFQRPQRISKPASGVWPLAWLCRRE